MKNQFEKLIEKLIPEINLLTVSRSGIKPGDVLMSQEKDIVIGYLPNYLKDIPPFNEDKLAVVEAPSQIMVEKLEGITSDKGALKIMDYLGLIYDSQKSYRINLKIDGITSARFANNINVVEFELAIKQLAKRDRNVYKKFKNHFLITEVIYAESFKVEVEVEKNGKFEADNKLEGINIKGNGEITKKENSILVSKNKDIPFGAYSFKIGRGKLKEKD